jgi:hypothetical protein
MPSQATAPVTGTITQTTTAPTGTAPTQTTTATGTNTVTFGAQTTTTTTTTTAKTSFLSSFATTRANLAACCAKVETDAEIAEAKAKVILEDLGVGLIDVLSVAIKLLQAGDTEIQVLINTLNAIEKVDPELASKLDIAITALTAADMAIKAIVGIANAGSSLVNTAGQVANDAAQGNTTATLADAQRIVPNLTSILSSAAQLGAKNQDGTKLDPQAIAQTVTDALTTAQQKNAVFTPLVQSTVTQLVAGAQPLVNEVAAAEAAQAAAGDISGSTTAPAVSEPTNTATVGSNPRP